MPTFYYATVDEGGGLVRTHAEPIAQWFGGRERFGREPLYCCPALKTALVGYLDLKPGHSPEPPAIAIRTTDPCCHVAYCPFCGEQVRWEHDLHLRQVQSEQMVQSWRLEVVEAG